MLPPLSWLKWLAEIMFAARASDSMLSLFRGMTGRMQGHPELDEGESVLHACYGLGGSIVAMANRSISFVTTTWETPQSGDEGLAAPIDRSGNLVLTDQRVMFFRKRFSIGTPKTLKASWPLRQVSSVEYAEDNLAIMFVNGSHASLHVPPLQKPRRLVDLFALRVPRQTSRDPTIQLRIVPSE